MLSSQRDPALSDGKKGGEGEQLEVDADVVVTCRTMSKSAERELVVEVGTALAEGGANPDVTNNRLGGVSGRASFASVLQKWLDLSSAVVLVGASEVSTKHGIATDDQVAA